MNLNNLRPLIFRYLGNPEKFKSPIVLRLFNGGMWSLIGSILSKVVVLVSTIIVAHILGKNSYGEYSIIRTTIFMFITLASLGLGGATTKYVSQYRDTDLHKAYNLYRVSFLFSIFFAMIIVVLLFLTSNWIAISQLDAPSLSESIRWGAILLFFCTLNGTQEGAIAGFEDFKTLAINSFMASIIEIAAICSLAYLVGVNGALIGSGISYIFLMCINYRSINEHFGNKVRKNADAIHKNDTSIIWEFGLPAALCNLLVIGALWISRTYLVRETNFGEIAVYNVADQIKTFILFIPSALSVVILPILTNIKHSEKHVSSYIKILNYNIIINIGVSFAIYMLVCLFASKILSLWGKGFDDPIPLIILGASAIFSAFATVVGQAIASQGKMWAGFICNLIWAILVLTLSRYFIKVGMGASGLALAILLAYVLHGFYQYIYLRYFLLRDK